MQASWRTILSVLLLAAFLWGQFVLGASQGIAGEAPIALDETSLSFDDNPDDKKSQGDDCGGLTLGCLLAGSNYKKQNIGLPCEAPMRRSRSADYRPATGPPAS